MENIGEIKAARTKFKNTRGTLYTRWNTDFNLYRLKPYSAGKGYYSYTTNSPRVLADKIIALLQQMKLIIRVPLGDMLDKERETATNIEKFLYGCLYLNDERLMKMGQPPLRDQAAWYSVIRGGVAYKVFVNKNDKGKTIPEIDAWDLYSTAYGYGKNGLAWGTHTRKATKGHILEEYPDLKFDASQDEIEVIDFWDDEKNGVIVGSDWAKELESHGCDGCPIYIVKGGTMPSIISDEDTDTEARRGESIFAANRLLYPALSKTMSDLLTLVRRGVKVPMVLKSPGGKKTLDSDMHQVEKTGVIYLDTLDDLKPAIPPTMPADTSALFGLLGGEEQRGGVSHVSFGELSFRLSGYALNELNAAIITVVAPFRNSLQYGYELIADALMEQFASGGYEPIEVMGKTSKDELFGYPKRLKIKASDLKKDWRPEIRLEPTLPRDDAQNVLLAKQLTEGDEPLMSRDSARDEVLGIQDPDLERKKIEEEWGSNIPIVRLQRTFQAYITRGRWDLAALVLQEIQKLMGQMEAQLPGAKRGREPTRLEGEAMGTPGAGLPPEGMEGIPPEVLPSEMMGGLPGGSLGAGTPPVGGI